MRNLTSKQLLMNEMRLQLEKDQMKAQPERLTLVEEENNKKAQKQKLILKKRLNK